MQTEVRQVEPINATAVDRLRRRMARLRRAGLFAGPPPGIVVSQAVTREDLEAAYALVHRTHVAAGFIRPQPGGMRIRAGFEDSSQMVTFVAKDAEQVIAVNSMFPDAPGVGLPSDQCFRVELDALRKLGRKVAEVTNQAVDPAYRHTSAPLELIRAMLACGQAMGCDDLFTVVSPGHAGFFEDALLFEAWGDERLYSDGIEDPVDFVVGERLDLCTLEARVLERDVLLGDEAVLHRFFFSGNPYKVEAS